MRLGYLLPLMAACGPAGGLPVAEQATIRPPLPPTDLSVRIVDRRATSMEVCWTAGSEERSRYDVRVAKEPITSQNFDREQDATQLAGGPWPFPCHAPNYSPAPPGPDCRVAAGSQPPEGDGRHASGLPGEDGRPPVTNHQGQRACYIVRGLYIENDYYFAVRAVESPPPPMGGPTS